MTNYHHFPKIMGTATVGERGQIVIPSAIRSKMKIKSGDKFLVFYKEGQFIGMIRAEKIDEFLDKIASNIAQRIKKIERFKKNIKRHAK